MWLCHRPNGDIEVRDENMPLKIKYILKPEELDPKLYIMTYGKYQGKSLFYIDANCNDIDYINWLKKNSDDLLLKQCLEKLI
jgi:hypothetical protein